MKELCQAAVTTTAFLDQKNAIKAEDIVQGKKPAFMQWFKRVINGANNSYL